MNTSTAIPLAVLTLTTAAHLGTAQELLDAPGPGYHQQVERLAPTRKAALSPHFIIGRTMQVYTAPGALSTEPLTGAEPPFSRPIQVFGSSLPVIKVGQGELRVTPTPAKPQ